METMEVIRIKDVVIEKISANDKELSRIFGLTERACGDIRREMRKLPSQQEHLRHNGSVVTIRGFDAYLLYRESKAGQKELAQFQKLRKLKSV